MVIVGIDGGMTRLGLAAIRSDKDGGIDLITYGLISNPRDEERYNDFLTKGITQITHSFDQFIGLVKAEYIFSETIPVGKLGSSDSQVVAAVTTCHVLAIQQGVPWENVAAVTVKKNITGDHKASKTVVRNAMLDMFPVVAERHMRLKQEQKEAGLKTRVGLPQDTFDALAIAVCGARILNGRNTSQEEKEAMQELQKA